MQRTTKVDEDAMTQLGMRTVVVSSLRRNQFGQFKAPYLLSTFSTCRLINAPLNHIQRALRVPQPRLYHIAHHEPTIYALSTAAGRAAIAVIRISGPACRQVGQFFQHISQPAAESSSDIRSTLSLNCLSKAPICDSAQTIYAESSSFAGNDT